MKLPLFPYQAQAADIMAGRDRYGLHDEMGIGKTATTIGAINRIRGNRGMVICPAMLRENWVAEFRKFSTEDLRVCKGVTIHDFVAWSRGRFDIICTSYEQAVSWHSKFRKRGEILDFIACDEAHYLKNEQTRRARAVLGLDASGYDSYIQWAIHA